MPVLIHGYADVVKSTLELRRLASRTAQSVCEAQLRHDW